MTLYIEKELFQWEKNRYVFVNRTENESAISCIQFYNSKSRTGPEIPLENGKAKIPNYLLKDYLPIVALGCTTDSEGTQVICRRTFKVLKRARPEFYVDDEDSVVKDVIYDGGVEV